MMLPMRTTALMMKHAIERRDWIKMHIQAAEFQVDGSVLRGSSNSSAVFPRLDCPTVISAFFA
jgi:hypothetical protein